MKRPFLQSWLLRACSVLGTQFIAFALSLQLYQKTGSLLDLGLIGLIQFVPTICLALPAGHLIDRYPPGRIAMFVQFANALVAALPLAPGFLGWSGTTIIFIAALFTGATRAFEHPVNTALIPMLVERRHVAGAVALTMTVAKTSGLVGPVLAGVIYAINPELCYLAAVVLCLFASAMALTLPAPSDRPERETMNWKLAFSGFSVIWHDPVLGGAMVLDLVAVLLGGATALLPAYSLDILHVQAAGLGILRAAPGVGAVFIGLWLSRHPVRRNAGMTLVITTCMFGLLTCAFGLSRSFLLSTLLLAGIGAADMLSIHIRSALVQLRTPAELRGRVGAVNGIFISSSNQIGAFESGVLASCLGLLPAVVIGGVGTILAALGIAAVCRPLRLTDRPGASI